MLDAPLLVPAIRLDRGEADAEIRRALARATQPWCAGFLLFGGEAAQVARLTADLRDAAGRDLLVASDMERGAGQQVRGLTLLPEAAILGLAATPSEVEAFGALTAAEARSVGVDVIFAPVLDVLSDARNPIVGYRAFGWDPTRVAALGRAYLRGVRRGGAGAVAKHYPGHGATTLDSHVARPVVDAPADVLAQRDLLPFDHALDAGELDAVMTAHVAYPALDPEGRIATESPVILERLRRRAAPREVVVFTDALTMAGALGADGAAGAARRALAAGCDLLLYAEDDEAVAAALDAGAGAAAAARVARWREAAPGAADGTPPPPDGIAAVAARAVDRVLAAPAPPGPVWIFDDDDVPGRGDALAAAAAARGREVHRLRAGRDPLPSSDALVHAGLVVLFASVRMAKGPSGLGEAARALLARVPGPTRLLALGAWTPRADAHVPGTHPVLEAALARRLFETIP